MTRQDDLPLDCQNGRVRGRKVVLRQKTIADAERDYAWRCDPELARYDATRPLRISFEDFVADYEEDLRRASAHGQRFAIETLDGRHIGNCMYYGANYHRQEAELGILIGDRDYWGRGYGTDSIRTLLRYIFQCTSLNRIYLRTLDWNVRAQRSFAHCGFHEFRREREGQYLFVIMDTWRDEFVAREEFKKSGEPEEP